MKTRNILSLALATAILVCISCDKDSTQTRLRECPDFVVEEGDIIDTEEYRVIDALIQNNFDDRSIVHVMQETGTVIIGNTLENSQEFLQSFDIELEDGLIQGYLDNNSTTSTWRTLFAEAEVMSEAEMDCFLVDNSTTCPSYLNKYPDGSGFLRFSRPFVFEGNTAIVEYISSCYGLTGFFVVLELQDEVWEVKDFFTTVIS